MFEAVLLLLVLGLANHQITFIVTRSALFEPLRHRLVLSGHVTLAYLLGCPLCTGTWVGFVLALLVSPVLVEQPLVNWLVVAFAVALVGRFVNELLAILAGSVKLLEAHQEHVAAQTTAVNAANGLAIQAAMKGALPLWASLTPSVGSVESPSA